MRGPQFSSSVNVLAAEGGGCLTPPDHMIEAFVDEILSAVPWEAYEIEGRPDDLLPRWSRRPRRQQYDRLNAEIVALYLARSWHFESAWWSDIALTRLFDADLPATKVVSNTHRRASDLRQEGRGQSKHHFLCQFWNDHTFFQVAAMRAGGVSATEASSKLAVWRERFSDGQFTVKASTIQKNFPDWSRDPLGGWIWCQQLDAAMRQLSEPERSGLVCANRLRSVLMPDSPVRLSGERR